MEQPRPLNPLERFLNLFTEVQSGEGRTVLLLCLNIFLILCAYYIIKPVREALILAEQGAEVKSYAAAGQALLLLAAVPLYAALATGISRQRLINIVTLFFTGCLIVFYVLAQFRFPLGVVFYLWVGIFNLMVPAQLWAFANDLYTPAEGKRLFAIVAFGASAGAVVGSLITGQLIAKVGVYQLLVLSAGILAVSLLITNLVNSWERQRVAGRVRSSLAAAEEPIGKGGAFRLVMSSKYLFLIGLLILFVNWVNTTGEYLLGRVVTQAAESAIAGGAIVEEMKGEFIGKFYADFFSVVNVAGLLIQLFLVSRIFKYLGVRVAILILPVLALSGYFVIAFYPVLAAIRWIKTAENATDYSLQNTVRHALFLPTTRVEKYKAKQATDTFFWRAGDMLQAALVYAGTTWLQFSTRDFSLFNAGLAAVWFGIALLLGLQFHRRTSGSPTEGPAGKLATSPTSG